VQHDASGGGRDSCWDLDEFAADCAAAHFAEVCAGEGANRAGEVEGDCGQHQPGRVRAEHPGRQVGQCAIFQVRFDLLDDGMPAAGFVRGHSVQGADFEERVEAVSVEEGALSVAFERVQFRDPANGPAPGDAFADLP